MYLYFVVFGVYLLQSFFVSHFLRCESCCFFFLFCCFFSLFMILLFCHFLCCLSVCHYLCCFLRYLSIHIYSFLSVISSIVCQSVVVYLVVFWFLNMILLWFCLSFLLLYYWIDKAILFTYLSYSSVKFVLVRLESKWFIKVITCTSSLYLSKILIQISCLSGILNFKKVCNVFLFFLIP